MTIRLALAGASGTGKSTIAKAISFNLGLPICPVGSREVSKAMGFENPYDVDAAGRRAEFQARLVAEKTRWEEENAAAGFVTDRTHFDNLAYTTMHSHQLAAEPGFRGRIFEAMRVYTHVVFCPIRSFHDLAGDPQRIADLGYHRHYEQIAWSLFIDVGCPAFDFYCLGSGDRNDRVGAVMRLVRPSGREQ